MPVWSGLSAQDSGRRVLFLTLGPLVGVVIGVVTNVLSSHWNWWVFSTLAALVALAAVIAVALDGGADAKRNAPPAAGRQARPRRKKDPAVNTLEIDPKDFTGRGNEISLLLRMVGDKKVAAARGGITLFSIEGIGGVGKTYLATHIAHRIAGEYPDGALFINLYGHTDGHAPVTPRDALALLLSALGIPGQSIPDSLEGRASLWRRELAGARVLVVLDNASGPEQIRDLLAGGDGCLFIITSRRRMTELSGVVSLPLEGLPPADAATLFARVLGTDSAGSQEADIAEVVRRLHYLPLAISLTATRLRGHPARTVRDLMERDINSRTDLEHVYDLSYQDLNPDMKSFFRLLAIHPGTEITVEAAAMLADIPVHVASDRLEELYNRYLLTEPVPHRFRFHDLIKDFARQEGPNMDDDAGRQGALDRLLGYYAFMAESASAKIGMGDLFAVQPPAGADPADIPNNDQRALNWFDRELGNLLACAYYASGHALLPYAWQLPAAMAYYLRLRGLLGQAVSLLDGALLALERNADLTGEATVLRSRGQLARLQDNYAFARSLISRSMQLTIELGDRQATAWCYHELAHLDRVEGKTSAAQSNFAEAIAINQDLGNLKGIAAAEAWLGILLRAEGDVEAAREYIVDALRISAEIQDRRGRALGLYQLGALERDSGNYSKARELITEALAIYDDTRNRQGQAECHTNLAKIERASANYEQAIKYLNEALAIYVELGHQKAEADTYAELAETADVAGNLAMSIVHRQRAETIYANLRQNQS